MKRGKVAEIMARELAGHFGPLFEELASDKRMLRAWRRQGHHVSDNTQADLIGAAQDALKAIEDAGFVVLPVNLGKTLPQDVADNAGPVGCCNLTASDVQGIHAAIIEQAEREAREDKPNE